MCILFYNNTNIRNVCILSSYFPPAEDGDYWRLINPGTHILTATAKGYSKVSKRVHIPHNMIRAGRVDFVLHKVVELRLIYVFPSFE